MAEKSCERIPDDVLEDFVRSRKRFFKFESATSGKRLRFSPLYRAIRTDESGTSPIGRLLKERESGKMQKRC
jgi:hypothetical protein